MGGFLHLDGHLSGYQPRPTDFTDFWSSLKMVISKRLQNRGWSLQIVIAASCIFAVCIFWQTHFTHVPAWHFMSGQSSAPTTTGHRDGNYMYRPAPPPSFFTKLANEVINWHPVQFRRSRTSSNFGKRWRSKQNTRAGECNCHACTNTSFAFFTTRLNEGFRALQWFQSAYLSPPHCNVALVSIFTQIPRVLYFRHIYVMTLQVW